MVTIDEIKSLIEKVIETKFDEESEKALKN